MRLLQSVITGLTGMVLLPLAAIATDKTITSTIHLTTKDGIGKKIGQITFENHKGGLLIKPDLSQIPSGFHGFHIHTNPSCQPAMKNGKKVPGLSAGGHFDPQNTNKHRGPNAFGHLGDLPALYVNRNQKATNPVFAPHLNVQTITGHSVIIHKHGDNYRDTPKKLGGGGKRIACGIIQSSNHD
jgi:Cu-Zn family superoxide dismutase